MVGRIVVAVGAGLLLLGACGWTTIGKNMTTDENTVGQQITGVRVASDSGDVTIRTGDRTTVRRTIHYDRDRPGGTHRVDNNVLVIESCPVRNCWIDYDVTVPAGTTVQGAVDSGSVEVDGVAGVNLKASSGDVTVRRISGQVNVDANSGRVVVNDVGGVVVINNESGNVNVDGAKAAVTVQAESGDVNVTLSSPQNVKARADSGHVDVTVPRGSYEVNATSDSGHVQNQVNGGSDASAHRLNLRTESGDITVQYA